MDDFRTRLALKAVAVPDFISDKDAYQPHPELVAISNAILRGFDLEQIADHAWRFQEQHKAELPVHVAARFRTIYRRIGRHLHFNSFAA
ncbi:hypothetical protein DEM26_18055 [Thioclava sp. NG1]|uniref:hypothetical protein n=1 Tax=Thioclava sp. NG1 TaxID=2182426 RepID=UPI000D61F064|nr:hypothetical protein [Thioclava sp. NG1]PWE48452.1 hypothetical protein DEM26_18055 [Thioclava sp. NG1]